MSGEQITAVGATFPLRSYTYDALNHLTEAGEWSLSHDPLGRLTSATLSTTAGVPLPAGYAFSQSLTPDGYGNNLSSMATATPGTMINFTVAVPPATNELPALATNAALTGWTYPSGLNNGEPETVGTGIGMAAPELGLAWDGLGRLSSAGSATYAYYPSGLRAARSDSANPMQSLSYAYTSGGKLLTAWVQPSAAQNQTLVSKGTLKSASKAGPMIVEKDPCDANITAPANNTTVQVGQSVLFTGTSSNGTAATWTFGDGGAGGSGFSASRSYSTAGTYTVTLNVTGPPTTTTPGKATITIKIVPAVAISSYTESAGTIPVGGSATLTWATTGATSVTLNGSSVATSGSQVVSPGSTTTYVLNASNGVTSANRSLGVTVVQAPVLSGFSASPGTLLAGATASLSWAVSGATSLAIAPGIGAVTGTSYAWTASVPGTSPVTTTYTLTATNTVNGVSVSRTAQATQTVDPDPTIPSIAFSASPSTLGGGQATTLSWNATSAVGTVTAVLSGGNLPPGGTAVASSGSMAVSPSGTTTYTLTAYSTELGAQAQGSSSLVVTVLNPVLPVISFSASPAGVQPGQTSTLAWNATSTLGTVTAVLTGGTLPAGGISVAPANGSQAVSPSVTTTYTLTATSTELGNQVSSSANVTVTVTPLPQILSFSASPATVTTGGNTVLTWSVTGATTLQLNGTTVSGSSILVTPTAQANSFTLVASNAMGSAPSATITVNMTNWVGDVIYLGDRAIAELNPTGLHELHCDHLGTPIVVTKGGTGAVESQQYFGAFGEQLLAATGYVPLTGYTGHLQTEPNGLIYMRGRFYSPAWHVFLNSDQGADPNQLNQYAYCGGSPIMRTDPSGMMVLFSGDSWRQGCRSSGDPMGSSIDGLPVSSSMANSVNNIAGASSSNATKAQTNQGQAGQSSQAYQTYVVAWIWNAQFPYFFDGGSVGHMAVFDFQDGDLETLVSQFPANGLPIGANQTDSFSQTLAAEGRNPDFVFLIGITNESGMDAEAAKQQAYASWTVVGGSNSTQCTISGVAVLQAGGVDIGSHWLPGFAGSNLVQLAGTPGSGVTQINQ